MKQRLRKWTEFNWIRMEFNEPSDEPSSAKRQTASRKYTAHSNSDDQIDDMKTVKMNLVELQL